jgi:hypothetical protein
LLELETVEDYAISTVQAFREVEFEGLTTTAGRMAELQLENKKDGSNWVRDNGSYGENTEEAEHREDDSKLSPPGSSTTEQCTEAGADIEKKKKNDDETDDDDDDSNGGGGGGGGGDNDDEDEDDDDDGDRDDENGDDDDDDDDDDKDGDEDDDDKDGDEDEDEDEDSRTQNPSVNSEEKKRTYREKVESRIKHGESSLRTLKKSRDFEDSVEHGRQWKNEDSSEVSEEFSTPGPKNVGDWPPVTATSTARISHSALATFLINGSPEAEDPESMNVTKKVGEEKDNRNTKKHRKSDEAKVDTIQKLQQIRELGKKANIPQKVKYTCISSNFIYSTVVRPFSVKSDSNN